MFLVVIAKYLSDQREEKEKKAKEEREKKKEEREKLRAAAHHPNSLQQRQFQLPSGGFQPVFQ
jgi:hypothetical protein